MSELGGVTAWANNSNYLMMEFKRNRSMFKMPTCFLMCFKSRRDIEFCATVPKPKWFCDQGLNEWLC